MSPPLDITFEDIPLEDVKDVKDVKGVPVNERNNDQRKGSRVS